MMERRIGAQLYTVEPYCQTEKDFHETLSKLHDIGYTRIQISGVNTVDISARTIKSMVDEFGMDIVCTHRSYTDFTDSLDKLINFHQELGCTIAGLGMMPKSFYYDIELFKGFIKTFKPIVRTLKENGMCFGYHNHAYEFSKLGGKRIMDWLLEDTDPDGFGFIPDTYWIAYAGINPPDLIRKMGDRAKVVHFKDLMMLDWLKADYAEVLEGNLDFDAIISACDDAGVLCGVVEQDVCYRNPFDSLKISYNNLKTKGFR